MTIIFFGVFGLIPAALVNIFFLNQRSASPRQVSGAFGILCMVPEKESNSGIRCRVDRSARSNGPEYRLKLSGLNESLNDDIILID